MTVSTEVRESVQALQALGGIVDVDAHEMAPNHLWGEIFGPAAAQIAPIVEPMLKKMGANDVYNPNVSGDVTEANYTTIWEQRGVRAPGAFDMDRRVDVLNQMGIDKQLLFPTFGLSALNLTEASPTDKVAFSEGRVSAEEGRELGRAGLAEYNAWAARTTAQAPDRLHPVGYISRAETPDELIAQAEGLLATGIRVLHLSVGYPPGGRSPAHPDLDPFYSLLTEKKVALTVHLGGEKGYLGSHEWINAPAFKPGKVESHEVGIEPYSFTTLHLPYSNWIVCMTLGGVFERHPDLRFGCIENGARWFGPLVDQMDMYARDVFATRLKPFISRLPSEYMVTNVRVSPFNDFEPLDEILTRYPNLVDCYAYSTDYPHTEGGYHSMERQYERIAHLGEGVVRKFFVENGRLLFPE